MRWTYRESAYLISEFVFHLDVVLVVFVFDGWRGRFGHASRIEEGGGRVERDSNSEPHSRFDASVTLLSFIPTWPRSRSKSAISHPKSIHCSLRPMLSSRSALMCHSAHKTYATQAGKLTDALEKLFALEKQTRNVRLRSAFMFLFR
jgi:hypothetical protein